MSEKQHREADELNPARNRDRMRPARHGADRTATAVRRIRPPEWEWSFFEDGGLALDPWAEPPPSLRPRRSFATVPRMPPTRVPGRARGRGRTGIRRVRRFAGLSAVATVLVVTLLLTAFGSPARLAGVGTSVVPVRSETASGLPLPQIVATQGPLRLQLPIAQSHVTAIGYHAAGEDAVRLDPLGRRGNQGLLGRLRDRIFGTDPDALVWYQLDGGRGPSSSSLDVGATPGTDVFSPVDGTIVGIQDVVIDGRTHGVRVDVQPASAPSLIVSVSRLRADPALTVGSSVIAAKTRIGTVVDLTAVERMALARFTQDAGNHISLVVRPAATLSLP